MITIQFKVLKTHETYSFLMTDAWPYNAAIYIWPHTLQLHFSYMVYVWSADWVTDWVWCTKDRKEQEKSAREGSAM